MSARPEQQARPAPVDGAIFQDGTARLLLFNDRRARFVGDTIMITIEERLQASVQKRRTSQPRESSAGCIFKNPVELPAGRLIEELGL